MYFDTYVKYVETLKYVDNYLKDNLKDRKERKSSLNSYSNIYLQEFIVTKIKKDGIRLLWFGNMRIMDDIYDGEVGKWNEIDCFHEDLLDNERFLALSVKLNDAKKFTSKRYDSRKNAKIIQNAVKEYGVEVQRLSRDLGGPNLTEDFNIPIKNSKHKICLKSFIDFTADDTLLCDLLPELIKLIQENTAIRKVR